MRRFIDRYLESKGLQTFAYLWDGVEQALKEAQYDTNAQSIRDDLRRGPVVKKDPKDPKALPAAKGSQDFKGPKGAKGPGKDKGKEGKSQNVVLPSSFYTPTASPLTFSTGGGSQKGSETLGFWASEFERVQNVYMLPQCPLAFSVGQLCADGFGFVWPAHGLPFLCPPSTSFTYALDGPCIEAHRLDHRVPIFRFSAPQLSPGLAAVPGGGGHRARRSFRSFVRTDRFAGADRRARTVGM